MTMTDERLAELDAVSQTIHGEPFAETINKILCEYSAWVAMPNKDVAEKVAFAALVKATMITDCTDNATIDAQAATITRQAEALREIVGLVVEAIDLERIGAVVALDAIADVAHATLKAQEQPR